MSSNPVVHIPLSYGDSVEDSITVISMSAIEGDQIALSHILADPSLGTSWHFCPVRTPERALVTIKQQRAQIVMCDGDVWPCAWKELLADIILVLNPPPLIVTSQLADEYLWCEALNLGAFDVLMKPFDPAEVVRVLELAWQRWKNGCEREQARAKRMKARAAV